MVECMSVVENERQRVILLFVAQRREVVRLVNISANANQSPRASAATMETSVHIESMAQCQDNTNRSNAVSARDVTNLMLNVDNFTIDSAMTEKPADFAVRAG